jgi:hypothetical protein
MKKFYYSKDFDLLTELLIIWNKVKRLFKRKEIVVDGSNGIPVAWIKAFKQVEENWQKLMDDYYDKFQPKKVSILEKMKGWIKRWI